ncbi:hypothetical protein AVEN_197528-1 [Araneus ventricosus]|uniref:STPR domain-containing protein n=1 Tax=Araneus ventricosus TaxID=182803 RepID=A0A4Y2BS20_ARAVE|nr:hypothetical protein AVEN_197528-1 [Araneus ventricosus]
MQLARHILSLLPFIKTDERGYTIVVGTFNLIPLVVLLCGALDIQTNPSAPLLRRNLAHIAFNGGLNAPQLEPERPILDEFVFVELIFGSYYFCFVQFSLFPIPKRKGGITGDVASRREAIRKRERRVVETEEERSRRLSTMAQHGQDRRAEETEEPRNSRLSDMAQRGQERRAEETEEQRKKRIRFLGT